MERFLARYKYTLLLALLVVFIGIPIMWHSAVEMRKCHQRGGEYVRTWNGYGCVERR